MMDQKASKLLKIAAVFVFAGMFLPWSGARAQQSQGQPQDHLDVLGYQSTLEEKLGRDDGASFIIHFGGDIHGNLDTCG
jgi:hypothetical protein